MKHTSGMALLGAAMVDEGGPGYVLCEQLGYTVLRQVCQRRRDRASMGVSHQCTGVGCPSHPEHPKPVTKKKAWPDRRCPGVSPPGEEPKPCGKPIGATAEHCKACNNWLTSQKRRERGDWDRLPKHLTRVGSKVVDLKGKRWKECPIGHCRPRRWVQYRSKGCSSCVKVGRKNPALSEVLRLGRARSVTGRIRDLQGQVARLEKEVEWLKKGAQGAVGEKVSAE